LVGATAVGKTAVVVAWAETESISVVSADARQVYRGLDIGTAKPSGALLARVPHLGLEVVEPGERYSAGRFARDAAQWLGQIRGAGRHPVVVGGTGLYVRALAEGLFHEPPLDPARRDRLRAWAAALTPARLAHWAARLDRRFAGVGCREVAAMLAGRLPERDLREAIVVATRRYAKRQETWFRHQLRDAGSGKGETGNVWTLDATASPDALATRILERWRSATAPG